MAKAGTIFDPTTQPSNISHRCLPCANCGRVRTFVAVAFTALSNAASFWWLGFQPVCGTALGLQGENTGEPTADFTQIVSRAG